MADRSTAKPALAGPLFGLLTFLAGIGLLGLTFKLAIDLFGVEPSRLFGLEPGKTLDLSKAGTLLMATVVKVLLLLVMALVGGLVASRGIKLYAEGRSTSVGSPEE